MTISPSGGLSQQDVNRLVGETRAREAEDRTQKEMEGLARQLDGIVSNTMRSVQALESRLKPDELKCILDAIENAKKVRTAGKLEPMRAGLAELERAASIIGQAMLRP
jgi:molecular chaperone DnaK